MWIAREIEEGFKFLYGWGWDFYSVVTLNFASSAPGPELLPDRHTFNGSEEKISFAFCSRRASFDADATRAGFEFQDVSVTLLPSLHGSLCLLCGLGADRC